MLINNVSHSIIIRLCLSNNTDVLSQVLSRISELGGHVGAIDIVKVEEDTVVRDITINTRDDQHVASLVDSLEEIVGVDVRHTSDRTFLLHLGGLPFRI